MKYIILIFVFFSCTQVVTLEKQNSLNALSDDLKSVVQRSMQLATLDSVHRRLIICAGQSNDGKYGTVALGGKVLGVYGFNVYKKVFEPKIDPTAQFETTPGSGLSLTTPNGLGGFQPALAKLLKSKYPNDSIYFVDFHIVGTGMEHWNITQGDLFFALNYLLKLAFQQRNFDRVDFIWTQGEQDCKLLNAANLYQRFENELFDFMQQTYSTTVILDYRLPKCLPSTSYPQKSIVNSAKETNCVGNRILINSDQYQYASDSTHMTPLVGCVQYANDLILHL